MCIQHRSKGMPTVGWSVTARWTATQAIPCLIKTVRILKTMGLSSSMDCNPGHSLLNQSCRNAQTTRLRTKRAISTVFFHNGCSSGLLCARVSSHSIGNLPSRRQAAEWN